MCELQTKMRIFEIRCVERDVEQQLNNRSTSTIHQSTPVTCFPREQVWQQRKACVQLDGSPSWLLLVAVPHQNKTKKRKKETHLFFDVERKCVLVDFFSNCFQTAQVSSSVNNFVVYSLQKKKKKKAHTAKLTTAKHIWMPALILIWDDDEVEKLLPVLVALPRPAWFPAGANTMSRLKASIVTDVC